MTRQLSCVPGSDLKLVRNTKYGMAYPRAAVEYKDLQPTQSLQQSLNTGLVYTVAQSHSHDTYSRYPFTAYMYNRHSCIQEATAANHHEYSIGRYVTDGKIGQKFRTNNAIFFFGGGGKGGNYYVK